MTSTRSSVTPRPGGRARNLCLSALFGALCAGDAALAQGPGPLTPPPSNATTSKWAAPTPGDPEGRLTYSQTAAGDRLPDFSMCGYGGGGVALPRVPVMFDLRPAPSGDDTRRIQDAIDYVASLPLGGDGFRGAVLLRQGTYRVEGSLKIEQSGVVLRGEGQGPGGTILHATGKKRRTLIVVSGKGSPREVPGTRQAIVDGRVPVGATRLTVQDGSGFSPGQRVIVLRRSTQEWIDFLGMDANDGKRGTSYDTSDIRDDSLTASRENRSTALTKPWKPGQHEVMSDRVVTTVAGNTITVDAPITTAIEQRFGGGFVYVAEFPGRIRQVGVENLRGVSAYAGATDEDHAWNLVDMARVEDAWIDRVTAEHFAYATAEIGVWSRRVTVQDCTSRDPKSRIAGGRRYAFRIAKGQLVLMQGLLSSEGRHDFVLGALTTGPNVFLDCRAERSHSDQGPHSNWSSGVLFDNVRTDGEFNVRKQAYDGTQHGWTGANSVLWNCRAGSMVVSDPPGAQNWAIGCEAGRRVGGGRFDAFGGRVWPPSLYRRQLEERLGGAAVTAGAPPTQVTPSSQANPGKKPGKQPGKKPGKQPGKQPGNQPGKAPGKQPGKAPGKQPGKRVRK